MQFNEFKDVAEFTKQTLPEETIRNGLYITAVSAVLNEHKSDILVRDNMDVDGTFAVLFRHNSMHPLDAIELYQDLRDVVGATLYMDVDMEGFIPELGNLEGFWLHFS